MELECGKGRYKFRIGARALLGKNAGTSIPGERHVLYAININHRCLLLDNDIFEYGNKGWARHKNIGMDSNYNWKRVPISYIGGKYAIYIGRTNVSPDSLYNIIYKSNEWTADKYDLISHNCQDFVNWCIRKIANS